MLFNIISYLWLAFILGVIVLPLILSTMNRPKRPAGAKSKEKKGKKGKKGEEAAEEEAPAEPALDFGTEFNEF